MAQPEIRETLRVSLTPDELLVKSRELARYLQETRDLEESIARERKQQSEMLKDRREEAQRLAEDVATGTEVREVSCVEVLRYRERLVDIVRIDNHEVVRTRAMQPEERQRDLFVVGDDEGETKH